MSVQKVIEFVEDAKVKVPRQMKEHSTPRGLENYLRGRKKLLEVQVSTLQEKIEALHRLLEEKKRQLEVVEMAIEELRREEYGS